MSGPTEPEVFHPQNRDTYRKELSKMVEPGDIGKSSVSAKKSAKNERQPTNDSPSWNCVSWKRVTVSLTAPREINTAAKSLKAKREENTTFPCDVSFWSWWFCLGLSNIQVRFQEFTLGIEDPFLNWTIPLLKPSFYWTIPLLNRFFALHRVNLCRSEVSQINFLW